MKTLQEQIKNLENQIAELKKKVENQTEFNYPIYCLSKVNYTIVKFTDIDKGVLMKDSEGIFKEGDIWNNFTPHTDTNFWEVLPICPRTGFYHKQRVWFWDNNNTHARRQGFYNAIDLCAYNTDGCKDGHEWDNYEAVTTPWEDWQIEAFKTLK